MNPAHLLTVLIFLAAVAPGTGETRPDSVALMTLPAWDCNGNGIDDAQDIADGTSTDCNGNDRPDECDLADGASQDFDHDRIPDECEGWPDRGILVYVPAAFDHGPQELVVGRPGDIYVAAIGDSIIHSMEIPLEVAAGGGGSLWPAVADTQVTFLSQAGDFLITEFFEAWQNGIWPDTLDAIFISGFLPPGVHNLMKMTVIPLESGTVGWSSPWFFSGGFHQLLFCFESGNCQMVALVADSIMVIDATACCAARGNVDHATGPGGLVDVNDLTYLVTYLFENGPPPVCAEEGNVDGVVGIGGGVDISDVIYLVAYLFQSGPPPPPCP